MSYVDLYLDLAFEAGVWHLLDEDELSAATEDDSRLARSSIELVRRLIETDARILDPTDAIWDVPADALGLEPRDDCLQEPFNENDALPRS